MEPGWRIEGNKLMGPGDEIIALYHPRKKVTELRRNARAMVLVAEGDKAPRWQVDMHKGYPSDMLHITEGNNLVQAYMGLAPHLTLQGTGRETSAILNAYTKRRFPDLDLHWKPDKEDRSVQGYYLLLGGEDISKPLFKGATHVAGMGDRFAITAFGRFAMIALDNLQDVIDSLKNPEDCLREISGPLGPIAAALLSKEEP